MLAFVALLARVEIEPWSVLVEMPAFAAND